MRNVLNASTFNGLPLNYSGKNNAGFYKEILQRIEALMTGMIRKHNQVFFVRFDLHYPDNSAHLSSDDNELLEGFIEPFIRRYNRRGYDPMYLWAREYSPTGLLHYHLILLVDADYFQNVNVIMEQAIEYWGRCLNIEYAGGYVHLCRPIKGTEGRFGGGVKIRRNDPNFQQVFANCFQQASYLAKCYSKGQSPANVNEFGCSRLS